MLSVYGNILVENIGLGDIDKMRKTTNILILLLSLSFLLIAIGCGDTGKINDLTEAANKYKEQKDYDNAIIVYNKILEIKEIPEIRAEIDETKQLKIKEQIDLVNDYRENGKLNDALEVITGLLNTGDNTELREIQNQIKNENEAVNKAKEFHEKLDELEKYYLQDTSYISPVKMEQAVKILREAISILESIKTGDTSIHSYVKNIKDSYEYQSVKRFSESTFTDDAEVSQSIGFMYEEMANINQISADLFINIYAKEIKVINQKDIPSKYN
ncbi:hypothetical protein D3C74_67710 [compost metagenome]